MKMKRKKLTVVSLVFSLIFFIGAVTGLIVASTTEKISEKNTTEFTATVTSIKTEGSGTGQFGKIYTEEYGDKLNIFYIKKIVDVDDFSDIQAGQTVFFRIENVWLEQFEEMDFVTIVSLKTAEKEILSLSSYAEYMEHQYFRIRITCIIFIPILLLSSIYCVLLLKGVNVFRRLKK
jgi:uncharacterized membrane protein YeiB